MKLAATIFKAARGLSLLLLLCPAASYAAFEDLGAGARGPGMGNAMAAAAEDVYAVHYNPAGLGLTGRAQFTAAYTQHFAGLTDGSALGTSFFGYAHPLEDGAKGTVAGAFNSFTLDGGLYRENTLSVGYGRRVYSSPEKSELHLGATLKYLYSSFGLFRETFNATSGVNLTGQADPVLGKKGHTAFDADLGALYRFNTHYQAGLQVARVLTPDMAFSGADTDKLPMSVKAAFNYRSLISNLVLQGETTKGPDGKADNRVIAAAEKWIPRQMAGDFAVRGALGLGSREYKEVSLGFSYRTRRMQADYAFSLPLGGIGGTSGSHRMAITFRFGKASDQEETLEMLLESLNDLKNKPKEDPAPNEEPQVEPPNDTVSDKLVKAEAAVKAGRYREAVGLTASVVEEQPDNASAWQTMGIAYLGMEKYKSSLYAWNKAYQYEKSPPLRQAIKGYIQSIGRLERGAARKQVKASVPHKAALPQDQIDLLLNRGVDYYVNREFDKAREMFEKVLEADPENVEAQKSLRRLKEEQKR